MLSKEEVLDRYFMDARCKLIDLAAFLDRVDRHEGEAGFRLDAFVKAIDVLKEAPSGVRARSILEHFSDHSEEPAEAAGMQGAIGAVPLGK